MGLPSSLVAVALLAMALGGEASVPRQQQPGCGYVSSGQPFIVNGRDATEEDLLGSPWHVGLYRATTGPERFEQFCAGTLVHPRVVVTAAHCLYKHKSELFDVKDVRVSVGSATRAWSETTSGHSQHLEVSGIIPHPEYGGRIRRYEADIGLLTLATPVITSNYVKPACMVWSSLDGPTLMNGSVGKVVGWGSTITNLRRPSPVLKVAEQPFIPRETCIKTVPITLQSSITRDHFCAGYAYENGTSVSFGDSGGGLTFERDGLWFLMGVVSVGSSERLTYSFFTKVPPFSNWIGAAIDKMEEDKASQLEEDRQNVRGEACCQNQPVTELLTNITAQHLAAGEKLLLRVEFDKFECQSINLWLCKPDGSDCRVLRLSELGPGGVLHYETYHGCKPRQHIAEPTTGQSLIGIKPEGERCLDKRDWGNKGMRLSPSSLSFDVERLPDGLAVWLRGKPARRVTMPAPRDYSILIVRPDFLSFKYDLVRSLPSNDCDSREFRCNNGICLSLNFKCDGIHDCPDGEDESPSMCNEPSVMLENRGQPVTTTVQFRPGHHSIHLLFCNDLMRCSTVELFPCNGTWQASEAGLRCNGQGAFCRDYNNFAPRVSCSMEEPDAPATTGQLEITLTVSFAQGTVRLVDPDGGSWSMNTIPDDHTRLRVRPKIWLTEMPVTFVRE